MCERKFCISEKEFCTFKLDIYTLFLHSISYKSVRKNSAKENVWHKTMILWLCSWWAIRGLWRRR